MKKRSTRRIYLILDAVQLRWCQPFFGTVAPEFSAYDFMQGLRESLGKTIGQSFCHNNIVVVVLFFKFGAQLIAPNKMFIDRVFKKEITLYDSLPESGRDGK